MSKRTLPQLRAADLVGLKSKVDDNVLSRWEKTLAAKESGDNVISIYDAIGADYFGEGVTAKRISAALRSIGADKDIVVAINSPGGDFFEGAAIYNLLAEHKGHVTVKVIGMAASAASVIAMAGDTIEVSQVGFLMIHNAWGMVIGNRHDMNQAADVFSKFDTSMRDLYAARTGVDAKDIEKLMDGETWLGAQEAVDKGFADSVIDVKAAEPENSDKKAKAMARRTIEMALAKQGLSRQEREEIFQKAGVRDAAELAQRDAGAEEEGWNELLNIMKH